MRSSRSVSVLPLLALASLLGAACGDSGPGTAPDEDELEPDDSEGTGNGGSKNSTAGSGGASGSGGSGAVGGAGGAAGTSAGSAGQGGQEPQPIPPGPPVLESMLPTEGAYGDVVTISGAFLGSANRAVQLRIGPSPAFTITPADSTFVESWTEDEIRFRYPFPAEGPIALDTPQGTVDIGEFSPSWVSELTATNAPASSVIASISTAPKTVTLLFDGTPPVLMELGPDSVTTHTVTLNGALPNSVRLYLAGDVIEGIGVSGGDTPELIHLVNVDGDLVGEPTGILLEATETALAGGPDGACAWLHRDDGWYQFRPVDGDWAVANGPVPDVQSASPDRAVGASSDGSLYVAWSVDTGNFFDDMEAPRMRRFSTSTLEWSDTISAGSSVDDYVTSIQILDKGRGVVVRYCGSDSDPWGVSSTSYVCYDGLHTPLGASIARVAVDVTASRHAFAAARAVAGYCDGAKTFRLRVDTDTADPGVPVGEPVVFPCQSTLALEIDSAGDFVPIIRRGTVLHRLGRSVPE